MIEIIPAIDLIGGQCVRLSQGDYASQRTYSISPLEMAKRYADCGVRRIHVVDLDGAKSSYPINLPVLEQLAALPLQVEWGGGIKTEAALNDVFHAGADFAIIGSTAVRQPEQFEAWLQRFGGERMVLGVDVRQGNVAINGWLEEVEVTLEELVNRFLPHGLSQVICTDITRDGMLQGPSDALYTRLQALYPTVDFTVSGGIGSMEDIRRLNALKLRKVIVGKAIYEHHITLNDLSSWLQNASSPASM